MSNTPDSKQEALRPCPFCPAQLIPFPKDHLPEDLQDDAAQWFQITHNAGCYFVLLGFGDYPIHQDRLKAWNTRASVAAVEGDAKCLGRFPTPSQADDDYPCDECGAAKVTHSQAALLWDALAHNLSGLTSRMANKDCAAVWDSFWALDAHLRTPAAASSPAPAPAEPKLDSQSVVRITEDDESRDVFVKLALIEQRFQHATTHDEVAALVWACRALIDADADQAPFFTVEFYDKTAVYTAALRLYFEHAARVLGRVPYPAEVDLIETGFCNPWLEKLNPERMERGRQLLEEIVDAAPAEPLQPTGEQELKS